MISNGKFKPDILIVDDHLIFRQGLKALLIRQNIANVIGEASNGVEYLELVSHLKPDLVLMDIDMPQMNGLEAIKRSQVLFPDLKIIVFTMFGDEDYYYKMIELGVKGYILKSSGISDLKMAISRVVQGESYFSNEMLQKIISNFSHKSEPKINEDIKFSPREMEILQQICLGLNNEDIALKLFISPKTVKRHRANLFEKTECKKSNELIVFALKNRIIAL